MTQQTNDIQKVKVEAFNPLAPVGSANALKSLMATQSKGLAEILPRHITPERILKTMLVAANRNPDIFKCTRGSTLETINRAAELGLDLSGTLGEAYPVPFNNKVKWTDESGRQREEYMLQLTLIIGYRGLEKLAWQTGEVASIDAEVVCEHDHFVFRKGTTVLVEWTPKMDGDRGRELGAYACVTLKNGGTLARFLPKSDIEKIRNSAKSKNSPAWTNWWGEMARKCALKRTLKDAPLSTEKYTKAMEIDDEDNGLMDVVEAETTKPGAAGLTSRLGIGSTHEPIIQQPDPTPPQQPEGDMLPPEETPEQEAERLRQEIAAKDAAEAQGDAPPQEPEQPQQDAPTGEPDFNDWPGFYAALEIAIGQKPAEQAIKVALVKYRKVGRPTETSVEQRKAIWAEATAARK